MKPLTFARKQREFWCRSRKAGNAAGVPEFPLGHQDPNCPYKAARTPACSGMPHGIPSIPLNCSDFFPMLVSSEVVILTSGWQGAFCCLETSAPPRPVALTHGKGENPRVPKERIIHRLQKVLKGPPDIGERQLLERKQHFPLWKRFGLGSIFTQATVFTQRSIICASV